MYNSARSKLGKRSHTINCIILKDTNHLLDENLLNMSNYELDGDSTDDGSSTSDEGNEGEDGNTEEEGEDGDEY